MGNEVQESLGEREGDGDTIKQKEFPMTPFSLYGFASSLGASDFCEAEIPPGFW